MNDSSRRIRSRLSLAYLRDLAVRRGGFARSGEWGWAGVAEIEAGTDTSLTGILPCLSRDGMILRADVRPPASRRAVWLYRITEEGARRVAVATGAPDRPIPLLRDPADADPAIYVPTRPMGVLSLLRLVLDARVGSRHLPEEPGWRTAAELTAMAQAAGAAADVCESSALAWLVRAGLAERRSVRHPLRRLPFVVYRASTLGAIIPILVWKNPQAPVARESNDPLACR